MAETSAGAENPQPARLGEGGVFWRMLRAHWDMRRQTRAMFDARPSETRLLTLIILAVSITFAARAIGFTLSGEDNLIARIGTSFIATILFGIPAFYLVAGVTGLVARAFRGAATWRETRTAVFWAALVSAPVVFAATVLQASLGARPDLAMAIGYIGSAYFGYAFCVAVAMANNFRSAWGVFGVTAATLAVIFGGFKLFAGGGF